MLAIRVWSSTFKKKINEFIPSTIEIYEMSLFQVYNVLLFDHATPATKTVSDIGTRLQSSM